MLPGRTYSRGNGRGNGRTSGRGDGRARTNGRHSAGDNVPVRQTIGFQSTPDIRFCYVALCLMGRNVQVVVRLFRTEYPILANLQRYKQAPEYFAL